MLFIIKPTKKAFAQRLGARGSESRERFSFLRYYYYVNVTVTLTLRYRSGRSVLRLRSVTEAGVKRIAARVLIRTLAVTSPCRILERLNFTGQYAD